MKKGVLAKLLISASCLTVAGAVGTIGVLSLLSDVVTNTGQFTATQHSIISDTLDITGAYQVYVNGSSTPEATNNVTLSSGDVAVVKATITNMGNNSAWVEDYIGWNMTNSFLSAAPGIHTANDFETGNVYLASEVGTGMYVIGIGSDESGNTGMATTTRVLNGTGASAQIETVSNAPASLKADVNTDNPRYGYNTAMFIGSNSYTVAYTYYFDPDSATTGGETINFTANTKALQYRANNTSFPIATCDTAEPPVCSDPWSVVVSSPTGL